MSLIAELEAQLRADPNDWPSWLVYADWLTDLDDERGQLIRLRHRLTTADLPADERAQVDAEVADIEARNRDTWLAGIPRQSVLGVDWRCGFVRSVALRGTSAVQALERLAGLPSARLLVEVRCSGLADGWVEPLVGMLPRLSLQRFGIRGAELDSRVVRKLADSFRSLRELELADSGVKYGAVSVLVESGAVRNLEVLDLSDNELHDKGLMVLSETDGLPNLRELVLPSNTLRRRGVEALAASAHVERLQKLDLGNNDLGSTGAAALATATYPALTWLELWSNDLRAAGADALAKLNAPSLRRLSVATNDLPPRAAGALSRAAFLPGLTSLDLRGNMVAEKGLERLVATTRDLEVLDLGLNDLDDASAGLLAAGTGLGKLRELHVDGNRIGAAGFDALTQPDALPSLRRLHVGDAPIPDAAEEALAARGVEVVRTS